MEEKKVKATNNKAADVETKGKLKELWAEYGELSAQQEVLSNQINQIIGRKNNVYRQILDLKSLEVKGEKRK